MARTNEITVPDDDRVAYLHVKRGNGWSKLPIIRDLRIAVGWQKGMLVAGLVLCVVFLCIAIFAPVIAPVRILADQGRGRRGIPDSSASEQRAYLGNDRGRL